MNPSIIIAEVEYNMHYYVREMLDKKFIFLVKKFIFYVIYKLFENLMANF